MTDEIAVYSYRRCPFAMRVRMTLHEKGVPFKIHEEDLANFSETLKALHPEAKVPVLVHGKTVLYESAIITEYIDETFPGNISLMPKAPALRAEVRLWTYWCNHLFKPDLDRYKYGTSRFPETECVGIEEKVKKHLDKLESKFKSSSWLVGESLSLADIHVFPFSRQLSRVDSAKAFFTSCSSLVKWMKKMGERPSFIRTIEK
jgi:glutathione S-transferase